MLQSNGGPEFPPGRGVGTNELHEIGLISVVFMQFLVQVLLNNRSIFSNQTQRLAAPCLGNPRSATQRVLYTSFLRRN